MLIINVNGVNSYVVADKVEDENDIKKIADAVVDHMAKFKYVDCGVVYRYVWDVLKGTHDTDSAVVCYLEDNNGKKTGIAGVVFFSIGTEWYSKEPMLYDRLILGIDMVGFGRIAVNILKKLMKPCVCLFDGACLADNPVMIRHGIKKYFKYRELPTYVIERDE